MDPSKDKSQSGLESIVQKLSDELASKKRELEVEAAVDGVRSRSLAMHQSSELRDVVAVLFDEMDKLGIPMHTVIINIFREGARVPDIWIASPGKAYSTPYVYFDHPIHTDVFKAREQGIDILAKTYSFEEKNEYFRHIFENADISNLSAERMKLVMDAPGYAISFAFTKNTAISMHSYTEVPFSHEHNHILKRFAFVFEQAYTRFKDLETAEKNARRAEREASLNRVRAEIAAMRSRGDLEQIIPLIWRELCSLGVSFSRCGVFIMDEEGQMVHAYLSNPEDTSPALLDIPFDCSGLIREITDCWKDDKIHRDVWDRDRFTEWVQTLVSRKVIPSVDDYLGAVHVPEPLFLHFVPFVQGMLYVGSKQELDSRQVKLVKSLSEAFSIAYARYEDFVRLQNAKNRIESALEKLKAAQNQLIQQEKLASLGQLTAGIAHEIKNPLNFVNNFSAVSVEMIDEVMEAIKKLSPGPGFAAGGPPGPKPADGPGAEMEPAGDSAKDEIVEILSDIKFNLSKIADHGKRADRIVTSMLQHSRGSTRAPEPTKLNTLVKEFVNLSFHGMRAGDRKSVV